MTRRFAAIASVIVSLLSRDAFADGPAPGAQAGPTPAPAWHAAAGVGTDFPIAVGARAHVEAPFRLRLSTSIGILPGPYVSAINGFVVAIGGYNDSTADLVKAALSSSLLWRTHLGFRPFPKLGFYFELGYGLVALGGSATTSALIEGVTGRTLPQSDRAGAAKSFDVKSTLHMLDVEIGWDFPIGERFQLRTAIGGAFTLASSTSVTPDFRPSAPVLVNDFAAFSANYLDGIYTKYVYTPVVSVSGSYVLF